MKSFSLAQVETLPFAQELNQYPLGMKIQDDHTNVKEQHGF